MTMLWYLILGLVSCTCTLATNYAPKDYNEQAEQAYAMKKLLDIESFFEVQNELDKITKVLDENYGLEHQAERAAEELNKISPQIEYLLDITKDLANPCRDGIYRNGKCANYIKVSKFNGTEGDARNLCLAHFGVFAKETIIDYSDMPFINYGGGYGGDAPNGGFYGGNAPNGGFYGGDAPNGGFYGGDASNGGGYGGDAPNGGGYGGDASNGGGLGGDAPNGGFYRGDASNGGGLGDDALNGGFYGGDESNGGFYAGDESNSGGFGGDALNGGFYGGDASNGGGLGGDASNGGFYGGDASNGGFYGGDAPLPTDGRPPYGDSSQPIGGGDAMPHPKPEELPPAVPCYVCYEPAVVNIPKSIYFPHELKEEEAELASITKPKPYPKPVNEKWFSGKYDPKYDEDACPHSARGGSVFGGMCYAVYDEPKDWLHAKAYCKVLGGNLCEPDASVAISAAFYSMLKAKLSEEMAEIEVAASPNVGANAHKAQLWLGWFITASGTDFLSQIGAVPFPFGSTIFAPLISSSPTTTLAAAITQPGNTWEGKNPATKLPFCCQFHLV